MISEISRILAGFRPCFNRTAAFNWFVTVVFGFIVRVDLCGASSFVRWQGIKPALYTVMLSFFRASFWQLGDILQRWWHIVLERCPLPEIDNRLLLAGDGIRICKEAEKMPAVKRLHQDSDNSGKAPYIYSHHWGVIDTPQIGGSICAFAVRFCLKKIPEPGRCLPGSGTDLFLD